MPFNEPLNQPLNKQQNPLADASNLAEQILSAAGTASNIDIYVALSGGMDSCVLLHLLVQWQLQYKQSQRQLAQGDKVQPSEVLNPPSITLNVLHFDHGLQPESGAWQIFCQELAAHYNLPFLSAQRPVQIDPKQGLEASARAARYAWFNDILSARRSSQVEESEQLEQHELADLADSNFIDNSLIDNNVQLLLTAHHADDQAETLLLNLLRGSGVAGLRGIAHCQRQAAYTVLRPLLSVTQQALTNYAEQHQLKWIDDPSNADQHYRRNALRAQVLPVLQAIKPDAVQQFAKSAEHMVAAQGLLSQLAQQDLQNIAQTTYCPLDQSYGLSLSDLRDLGLAQGHDRQANVLRHWLTQCGYSAESQHNIQSLLSWANQGTGDKSELRHKKRVFRVYRDTLFVMPFKPMGQDLEQRVWHDLHVPLLLPELACHLVCNDPKQAEQHQQVQLLFGEAARQAFSLKKRFQEAAVPHWRRAVTPVLVSDNGLLGIAGSQRDQWLQLLQTSA